MKHKCKLPWINLASTKLINRPWRFYWRDFFKFFQIMTNNSSEPLIFHEDVINDSSTLIAKFGPTFLAYEPLSRTNLNPFLILTRFRQRINSVRMNTFEKLRVRTYTSAGRVEPRQPLFYTSVHPREQFVWNFDENSPNNFLFFCTSTSTSTTAVVETF